MVLSRSVNEPIVNNSNKKVDIFSLNRSDSEDCRLWHGQRHLPGGLLQKGWKDSLACQVDAAGGILRWDLHVQNRRLVI